MIACDYMVSWGRAFKGAAGIIGFAIIWWIVGGILIAVGMMMSGYGMSGFTFRSGAMSFASMGIGIVVAFIGYLIGILGSVAAVLKILPEIVAEEVKQI